jgi:arylsulfatase A-like enzyme
VLILLLDDVGIDQLASYDDENGYLDAAGYPYAHLPNIDALAGRGVRFTQFRSMPVCSPTRASLLTGLYPFRHGVGRSVYPDYATERFRELGVPPAPAVALAPSLLARAGYATAAVGKWHLALEPSEGGTLDRHPLDLGFGAWSGPPRNLMDPGSPEESDGVPRGYYNYWWVEDGERRQVVGEHASQRTCTSAAEWVASAPEPWFCYVAFNACHAPLGPGSWPRDGHGFGTEPSEGWRNTRYRATLEHLDTWLGPLLEAAGDDTVVFLLGDNGTRGPTFRPREDEPRYPTGHPLHRPGDETRPFSTEPYDPRRAKQSTFETAVRVPLIVAGPGVAAPGRVSGALVDVVDLLPTILALAGTGTPEGLELDGIDFLDVLQDPAAPGRRDWSFAEYFYPNGVGDPRTRVHQERAYLRRDGPHLWKLVHSFSRESGELRERRGLFHVSGPDWVSPDGSIVAPADPFEHTDLGRAHPQFKPTNQALKRLVGER